MGANRGEEFSQALRLKQVFDEMVGHESVELLDRNRITPTALPTLAARGRPIA
jgi:hypothetical protein